MTLGSGFLLYLKKHKKKRLAKLVDFLEYSSIKLFLPYLNAGILSKRKCDKECRLQQL